MDEQPVAFATTVRSPNNCVISFTYGVSPQPEHAPLNSNRGCISCTSFTWVTLSAVRSTSGRSRKNSQLRASFSRTGGCAIMLIARCFTSVFDFAGHASTHSAQPVQSSGATCSVYFWLANVFHFASADLKPSGAFASAAPSYTLARITACGHTSTHLPHWMHSFSS